MQQQNACITGKQVIIHMLSEGIKKTALFDSSYSTDAQFVELFKKNDRIIYDNAGDNLDSLRCRIISLGN